LGIALLAAVIPFTPVSGALGFDRLPPIYFVILAGFVIAYLLLVEVVKWRFYAGLHVGEPVGTKEPEIRRIDRRASWFDRRTPGEPTRNRKRRTLVVRAAQWIDRRRRRGGGAR
jgi:Mg2+-importing ATPase